MNFIHGRNTNNNLIISLTSHPKRIKNSHIAIESLLKQTIKADKVILWLGKDKFPNKEQDLPNELLKLREKGLTIEWCKDIGSYTKLIPALKKYPNSIIEPQMMISSMKKTGLKNYITHILYTQMM